MIVRAGITYKYKNLLWHDQTSRKMLFLLVTFFTCFHLPPSHSLPTIICHTHPLYVLLQYIHESPLQSSSCLTFPYSASLVKYIHYPSAAHAQTIFSFAYQTCSPNDCPSDIHPSPFQRKSSTLTPSAPISSNHKS